MKLLLSLFPLFLALSLAACSTQSAPSGLTLGGTVVNLSHATGNLVLQNNLKDSLTVTANGNFTFRTRIASGGSYSVKVSVQPSNPTQICSVANGSGTATANITNVQVNCGHNEWAWEKGAATVDPIPVYGTQGVPAANNTPGARQLAATWTDTSGNFWLFGGFAFDNAGNSYMQMNDLWKFSSGQWTWVGGSNAGNQSGIYGTLGVPIHKQHARGTQCSCQLDRCFRQCLALWRSRLRFSRQRWIPERPMEIQPGPMGVDERL